MSRESVRPFPIPRRSIGGAGGPGGGPQMWGRFKEALLRRRGLIEIHNGHQMFELTGNKKSIKLAF